ncbi:hypothetical protein [Streptomyces sp. 3N207]|uniref:hypothetical protein n=1 Tax=Streptomyces sp. 3N207 TaxID=3457417 RepID=UPI003FD58F72
MRQLAEHLGTVFRELQDTGPPLEETIRAIIGAVAEQHRIDPHTHRLLYDQAPRPPQAARQLRELQAGFAAHVEEHLRRLDVGGPDHYLTALLLVQAVDAQVHGAVLDPPSGRTTQQSIEAATTLCLRSLGGTP